MLTAEQVRTVGLFIGGAPWCIECAHQFLTEQGVPDEWNRTTNDLYAFAQYNANRDNNDVQDFIEYELYEMVSAYNEHVYCNICGKQMDDADLEEEEKEEEI
jgi:hypothetical protein